MCIKFFRVPKWLPVFLLLGTIPFLLIIGFGATCIGTMSKMNQFKHINAGTPIFQIHIDHGKPDQIVHSGESLNHATAGYRISQPDSHTEIHVYARDGIPYYNVFIYVDSRTNLIQKIDVENLWW